MSPIFNASSLSLTEVTGTLPNVSGAMLDYFQTMIFTQISKTVSNFQTIETAIPVTFRGILQPSGAQQNEIRPDGQQAWKYYTLHAEVTLSLNPDDVVIYQGVQYRVMSKMDYSLYGYLEYQLVSDWQGVGP